MRKALPDSAKISKEAIELMQLCATEFVAFISAEAQDTVEKENRRTMEGEDLIKACQELGFEHYDQLLAIYQQHLNPS